MVTSGRYLRIAIGVVLLATLLVGPSGTPASAVVIPLDPDGEWGPVEDWPLVGIHAILTSEGDVLSYGTNADGSLTGAYSYDVWTPGPLAAEGHATQENESGSDLFCNLQLTRADTGEVLMFGGDQWTGSGDLANPDINSFDPVTQTLSTLPGMNRERWYATGTTLADGSMYIQGGTGGEDRPELWTAERGAELLPFFTSEIDYWYPRNYLLPDGRIFGFDITGKMYTISEDLMTMSQIGSLDLPPNARGSTAVMFEPGKILEFGGDTTTAYIIDFTGVDPVVTVTGSMAAERAWVNGVILPDGRVLAIGGAEIDSQQLPDNEIDTYNVAYAAEVWDPDTGLWTTMASNAEPRLYHSTALLLPDGRVLSAGGGAPGPVTNTTAELFSPDYLVAADGTATPRLSILGLNRRVFQTGDVVGLRVDGEVGRVTMVKAGSVTHSVDMDQRFLEIEEFTPTGQDRLFFSLPEEAAVIPPGNYLISVLDENDIPSESEMITITSDLPPPPSPPPAPEQAMIGDSVTYSDGSPAENVQVDLFTADADGNRLVYLRSATTDVDGSYEFVVDAGCYAETFIAPEGTTFSGGGAYFSNNVCVQPGEAALGLDAVLVVDGQGSSAIGDSVTFSDGSPAADVSIDLFESNEAGERLSYLQTTTSDADGIYRFDLAVAGCFAVTFVAPTGETFVSGSGWHTQSTCVLDGEVNNEVDAVLAAEAQDLGTMTGVITDAVGAPVADLAVDLFEAQADGSRGSYLSSTTSDADGVYLFERPAGCYVFTFIAPDGQAFTNGSQWYTAGTCVEANQTVNDVNPSLV